MNRRTALGASAVAVGAMAARRARGQGKAKYRVAVIGHTGRGNYGHGLDRVWREFADCEIVGVADANPRGLAGAVKGLGAPKGWSDYRKMLDEVRPDLVSICPRWPDQHRDMALAACERGVRGIYMEKPMCRTLAEADEIVAACAKHKVKLALSHQTRYSPRLAVVAKLIAGGAIGRVLEFRGRGKEDRRGGGEDLWVLGSHIMNLIHTLGGMPAWCSATVQQAGRPAGAKDVKPGAEGLGSLAGDEVHAMYRLASGATAYFDSTKNAGGNPTRFGLQVFGSKGIIDLYTGHLPAAFLLPDSSWSPGRSGKKWIPITSAGPGKPEPLKDGGLHGGNVLAVADLIASVADAARQPLCSAAAGRVTVEMIAAVFESHRQGRPVRIPLANRKNPLTMLK